MPEPAPSPDPRPVPFKVVFKDVIIFERRFDIRGLP
jgi:hypothetical protein